MTALGKLVRTTAFKIVAVYLIVFAIFAAATIAYLARHTQQLVVEQITDNVDTEMRGLQEQFVAGGINRLVDVVEARAQQPGSNLYLITTFAGVTIVGNVESAEPHARSAGLVGNLLSSRGGSRPGARKPRAHTRGGPIGRVPTARRPRLRGARPAARDPRRDPPAGQ